MIIYGTGLDYKHPFILSLIQSDEELRDKKFFHVNLNCIFGAKFTFPNEYDEFFDHYVLYAKNI